eukprot:jgi/Bigna1/83725/fgenesh1_pg.114_\
METLWASGRRRKARRRVLRQLCTISFCGFVLCFIPKGNLAKLNHQNFRASFATNFQGLGIDIEAWRKRRDTWQRNPKQALMALEVFGPSHENLPFQLQEIKNPSHKHQFLQKHQYKQLMDPNRHQPVLFEARLALERQALDTDVTMFVGFGTSKKAAEHACALKACQALLHGSAAVVAESATSQGMKSESRQGTSAATAGSSRMAPPPLPHGQSTYKSGCNEKDSWRRYDKGYDGAANGKGDERNGGDGSGRRIIIPSAQELLKLEGIFPSEGVEVIREDFPPPPSSSRSSSLSHHSLLHQLSRRLRLPRFPRKDNDEGDVDDGQGGTSVLHYNDDDDDGDDDDTYKERQQDHDYDYNHFPRFRATLRLRLPNDETEGGRNNDSGEGTAAGISAECATQPACEKDVGGEGDQVQHRKRKKLKHRGPSFFVAVARSKKEATQRACSLAYRAMIERWQANTPCVASSTLMPLPQITKGSYEARVFHGLLASPKMKISPVPKEALPLLLPEEMEATAGNDHRAAQQRKKRASWLIARLVLPAWGVESFVISDNKGEARTTCAYHALRQIMDIEQQKQQRQQQQPQTGCEDTLSPHPTAPRLELTAAQIGQIDRLLVLWEQQQQQRQVAREEEREEEEEEEEEENRQRAAAAELEEMCQKQQQDVQDEDDKMEGGGGGDPTAGIRTKPVRKGEEKVKEDEKDKIDCSSNRPLLGEEKEVDDPQEQPWQQQQQQLQLVESLNAYARRDAQRRRTEPRFEKIRDERAQLPVQQLGEKVLQALNTSRVLVLQGDTG